MKRKFHAGMTSVALPIKIFDNTSSTGAGLGSLVYNSSGLTAEYRRHGQSSWTSIPLQTMTLGTWVQGGFIADGTRPGAYELGIPDAAVAAGARWVAIRLYGAANMLDCDIELELDVVDYQDGVRFGLTSIPNAVAGAASGLPLLDASSHLIVYSVSQAITLPTIPNDWIAAAGIASGALNGKGDWLNAAGTRTALGMASANLDSQLSALSALHPSNFSAFAIDTSGRIRIQPGGLDDISVADPGSPALHSTFPKMMVGVWRSIYKKATLTATYLRMYANDDTTINSTQAVSDDGTTQTRGSAS